MESLLIPKHQPNFPHEDINDVNRELFQQLLLEPSYVETSHELAEQHMIAYKLGHHVLNTLSHELNMDIVQVNSFNYGVTLYESIATTIKPVTFEISGLASLHKSLEDVQLLSASPFDAAMHMRDQEERFIEKTPNMAELVTIGSQLYPRIDQRYARMGAALEWNIDRNIVQ